MMSILSYKDEVIKISRFESDAFFRLQQILPQATESCSNNSKLSVMVFWTLLHNISLGNLLNQFLKVSYTSPKLTSPTTFGLAAGLLFGRIGSSKHDFYTIFDGEYFWIFYFEVSRKTSIFNFFGSVIFGGLQITEYHMWKVKTNLEMFAMVDLVIQRSFMILERSIVIPWRTDWVRRRKNILEIFSKFFENHF